AGTIRQHGSPERHRLVAPVGPGPVHLALKAGDIRCAEPDGAVARLTGAEIEAALVERQPLEVGRIGHRAEPADVEHDGALQRLKIARPRDELVAAAGDTDGTDDCNLAGVR